MSSNESLGFVETVGLVAAIEAADAMVKTAQVRVKTVCNADAALLSVICTGDLAACKAAVDAGKAAASRVGDCVNSNLIAGDTNNNLVFENGETWIFLLTNFAFFAQRLMPGPMSTARQAGPRLQEGVILPRSIRRIPQQLTDRRDDARSLHRAVAKHQ